LDFHLDAQLLPAPIPAPLHVVAHGDPGWKGPGGPSSRFLGRLFERILTIPAGHGDPGWSSALRTWHGNPSVFGNDSVRPDDIKVEGIKAIVHVVESQVWATSSSRALYLAVLFGERPPLVKSWADWWDAIRAWQKSPLNPGDLTVRAASNSDSEYSNLWLNPERRDFTLGGSGLKVIVDLLGPQVTAISSNRALYLAVLFGERPPLVKSWADWWDAVQAWQKSPLNPGDLTISDD
jgi:hypothetical protein